MKNYTPAQARKFFQTRTVTFALGDIQYYKSKGRTVWIDNRTEHIDRKSEQELAIVYPVAIDEHRVYVICPHCQSYHVHGNGADGYEGHRCSDCYQIVYYVKTIPAQNCAG